MITRPRLLLLLLLLLLATQLAMSYAPEEEVSQEDPEQHDTAVPPQSTRAPVTQGQSSNGKHGGPSHLAPRPPSERSQRPLCRLGAEDNSVPTRPAATGTAGQEMSENTGTFFEPLLGAHGQHPALGRRAASAAAARLAHKQSHRSASVVTADLHHDNVATGRHIPTLLLSDPCGDVHTNLAAYGSAIHDDTLKHINPDDVFHPPLTVNTADFEQDNVAYVRRFLNLLHLNPCGDVHSKAAYWSAIHRNDALTTIYRPDTFKRINPDDVYHSSLTVNTADLEQDNVAYVRRFLNILHFNPCGDVHTKLAVSVAD